MANTDKIEREAVRAVEGYLDKCPKLKPIINSNDKTPIWDGDIYVYINDNQKNENFFARVPLQVKGTTIAEDNTFRLSREYLDGFKAERGTAFFMVKVDENSSNVFYALLSSKDIDILLQKRAQTIKIELNPVPTDPLDFEKELYAYATKRNSEKIENPSEINPQSNINIGDGKRNENSSVILNLINGLIRSLKILFGGKKYPSEIKPLMEGFEEIRGHLEKIENKEARIELGGLLDIIKNLKDDNTVGWRDKFYFFSRKAIDLAINNIEGYDFADLQFKLGNYLYVQKQYHLAENYYSKVLKEYRKRADIVNVAKTLNNLGNLHCNLTRYAEAEEEYQEALEIRRELARTNRDAYIGVVAETLNNLAALHYNLTRYAEAEKEYKEALEIYRELARTNRDAYIGAVAMTLNNLGLLHSDLTRYDEAEKEYKEALEIRRELAKSNRDAYIGYVSDTLNNLGTLHSDLNRYDEAEKEYKEALKIRRELAKTNRDAYIGKVAMTLNNLGNLHSDLNRYDEAEKEYKEVLNIFRELAETNHDAYIGYVAQTLNNLAILHWNIKRYAETEDEHNEALEIYRELARNNRDAFIAYVAWTLNGLGCLHKDLTRYAEAEKEYKEALEIRRELAETNRDAYIGDVAMTLENIALLQKATDRKAEAKKTAEEALGIYKELAKAYPQIWNRYIEKTEILLLQINES